MNGLWPLPSGWAWALFGDVARVDSNLVDPAAHAQLPHIAPNHIESGTGRLLEYTTVGDDGVTSGKHAFRAGHILYSKIRPYLAKAVVVDFAGLCSADMYPVSTGLLETRFLHRWLISPMFTEQAARNQGRTVLPKINQDALAQLPVPVAPRNEQCRIVAKLEGLQTRSRRAREALDAVPALLETLRQSILAAAFRGDLTKDWRAKRKDAEPASEFLKLIRAERRKKWEEAELAKMKAKGNAPTDDKWKGRYKEGANLKDDLAGLPTGWVQASIDSVGDLLLGRRRAGEEYVDGEEGRVLRPYVRVANVKEDRLDLTDVLQMPFNDAELRVYRLEPGDIILSEGQSAELVGQSATYEGGMDDLCIQATVHRFRALPTATTSGFAQLVFLHHLHTGVFMSAAALTTNIAHLTSERLKPLPFPLPALAEQAVIVERVRRALTRVRALEDVAAALKRDHRSLENALLAKAFRGQLVPQDPNDEPADAMLARQRQTNQDDTKPERVPERGRRSTTRRERTPVAQRERRDAQS